MFLLRKFYTSHVQLWIIWRFTLSVRAFQLLTMKADCNILWRTFCHLLSMAFVIYLALKLKVYWYVVVIIIVAPWSMKLWYEALRIITSKETQTVRNVKNWVKLRFSWKILSKREIPFSPPKMSIRFSPLFGLRFKKINFSEDFGILMKKIRSGDFSIFDYWFAKIPFSPPNRR